MDPYFGEIRLFSFDYPPVNWLACNGSLAPITQYQSLYALIGLTYGGDGVNTFGLPDLRGRVPIGQGNGTGLTNRYIGQSLGAETVTLTTNNIPQHNHTIMVSNGASAYKNPSGKILGQAPGGLYDPTPNTLTKMEDDMIGYTGATTTDPHENMQPYLVLNYCICVNNGLWPEHP